MVNAVGLRDEAVQLDVVGQEPGAQLAGQRRQRVGPRARVPLPCLSRPPHAPLWCPWPAPAGPWRGTSRGWELATVRPGLVGEAANSVALSPALAVPLGRSEVQLGERISGPAEPWEAARSPS